MKNISGERLIPYSRQAVFHEGLEAYHWAYQNKGFRIAPRDGRIVEDGIIDISIKKILPLSFSAVVMECVKNQHVMVEGEASGFGEIGLAIDLEDGDKRGTTVAHYDLAVDLGRMNRIARLAVEGQLRGYLVGEMSPFIDQLADNISDSIANQSVPLAS